jgi:hypothetical protein
LDARAVIFKFFFDLPKTPSEDKPNPAEMRFPISLAAVPSRIMKGRRGWLPLPGFSAAAYGLGFVNLRQPDSIPMVVEYDGKVYRSLWLVALQLALPELAIDGKSLRYRDRTIKLDS